MNGNYTPNWTVVSQQETARPAAGGQVVRGMLVTFQLQGGPTGTVFIPDNQYTVAYVRDAIAERAAQMHAVQSLNG